MSRETRNLVIFLSTTFVWTWAWYAPIALSGNSPYTMPWTLMLIMGGMGPSLIGVAMVLLTYDRDARRDYWRRCFSVVRISPSWWVLIVALSPGILAVSIALDVALGGSLPPMVLLRSLIAAPLAIPLASFIRFMSGPWSEEFGWRGYALDPMIARLGLIAGSVLLGLIWGVWHLPLFFMPATGQGQSGFGLTGFWTFLAYNVGLSLLMDLPANEPQHPLSDDDALCWQLLRAAHRAVLRTGGGGPGAAPGAGRPGRLPAAQPPAASAAHPR